MITSRFLKKLKGDPTGLIGLFFLCFAAIVAILGANIRPDASQNANQQHPQLAKLPPGSEITFFQLSKAPETSFLNGLLFGGTETHAETPVFSYRMQGDSAYYFPATSTGKIAVEKVILQSKIEEIIVRKYYLGADKLGRDVLSRLMAGTVVSLSVGFISVGISLVIGIFFGAIAGFFGGWIDKLIMWWVNVVWSVPTLLMVMAITLALGKGFVQVFIAVGLTMWVEVARVTRGRFMEIKQQDYIMAAQLLNAPKYKILFREMLPNAMGPLIVIAAGNFSTAILLEAGLSFLGIGAQVPMPSWGGMIKSHFAYLTSDAAFIPIVPGIAIMLLVLSFIWIGNTLRDTLDVKA